MFILFFVLALLFFIGLVLVVRTNPEFMSPLMSKLMGTMIIFCFIGCITFVVLGIFSLMT